MDKYLNFINLYYQRFIPSYEEKRTILLFYKNKFNLKYFVETGTFLGDTVDFFKGTFDKIYSIELSEELATKATNRFKGQNNIRILQGDSSDVLISLISRFKEPALFWLDGHYSSEFYIGDEYIKTAKGKLDTPVESELENILSTNLNHVILIDDARLFKGINDYPSISKVKKIVYYYKNNYKVKVENDIIQIYPYENSMNLLQKIYLKIKIEVTFLLEQKLGWRKPKDPFNIPKYYFKKYLPANQIIIDCGAHIGADSVELAKIFPKSQIHSFEPVPSLFTTLKAMTSKYSNIECHQIALSNQNGTANFFVSSGDSDASSSLLLPTGHIEIHKNVLFNEQIQVPTITLDDWAKNNNISKIDFLWLDMQGFELQMLKASSTIIQTVKAIHTEVSITNSYEGAVLYPEYKKWLEEMGFKAVIEAIPDHTDMGNVLFVRNFEIS